MSEDLTRTRLFIHSIEDDGGRDHGIREIYTTDSDFLQFPDIRVLNRVRPPESP